MPQVIANYNFICLIRMLNIRDHIFPTRSGPFEPLATIYLSDIDKKIIKADSSFFVGLTYFQVRTVIL